MSEFKKHRRTKIAELRPVTEKDINDFFIYSDIIVHETKDNVIVVSISDVDRKNGSPKIGDMVARNPKNHLDQWLVNERYYKDNFDLI